VADHRRTPRDIEREVEVERAELRETIEELISRFTFEEVWTRAGAYLRDNRGELGHSLGRAVKEKPLAVALTVVGIGWLLFGPSQQPAHSADGDRRTRLKRDVQNDHAKTRARLEQADFAAPSARGPAGADATADPWEAPTRTTAEDARLQADGSGRDAPGAKAQELPGSAAPKRAGE
jgi:hypothetical protein